MKILDSNEYINEKLTIQPVTRERLVDLKDPEVDEKTKQFIENNNLIWNPITKSYDCAGNINVSEEIVTDGKLKIGFGKVGGYFVCNNNKLTTLEGAPQEIGKDFDCSGNGLTTIEGAPKKVGGYFSCSYNKLTSLEGAPKKVGGHFYCHNNKLTSLEGSPKEIGGYFNCSNNNLTTLDGAPNNVGGNFICNNNPNLVLPKRKPSWIKGKIIC